jgi:hypothetical protein
MKVFCKDCKYHKQRKATRYDYITGNDLDYCYYSELEGIDPVSGAEIYSNPVLCREKNQCLDCKNYMEVVE